MVYSLELQDSPLWGSVSCLLGKKRLSVSVCFPSVAQFYPFGLPQGEIEAVGLLDGGLGKTLETEMRPSTFTDHSGSFAQFFRSSDGFSLQILMLSHLALAELHGWDCSQFRGVGQEKGRIPSIPSVYREQLSQVLCREGFLMEFVAVVAI